MRRLGLLLSIVFMVGVAMVSSSFMTGSAASSVAPDTVSISGTFSHDGSMPTNLASASLTCDGEEIAVSDSGTYSATVKVGSLLVARLDGYNVIRKFVDEDGTCDFEFSLPRLNETKGGTGLKYHEDGSFSFVNYSGRNVTIAASEGSRADDDFFVSVKVVENLGKEEIGFSFYDPQTQDGLSFMVDTSQSRVCYLQRQADGYEFYDPREWTPGVSTAWQLARAVFGTVADADDAKLHGEISIALAKIDGVFHVFAQQGTFTYHGTCAPTWYRYNGTNWSGKPLNECDYYLGIGSDNLEDFDKNGNPLALYGVTRYKDLFYTCSTDEVSAKIAEWGATN